MVQGKKQLNSKTKFAMLLSGECKLNCVKLQ